MIDACWVRTGPGLPARAVEEPAGPWLRFRCSLGLQPGVSLNQWHGGPQSSGTAGCHLGLVLQAGAAEGEDPGSCGHVSCKLSTGSGQRWWLLSLFGKLGPRATVTSPGQPGPLALRPSAASCCPGDLVLRLVQSSQPAGAHSGCLGAREKLQWNSRKQLGACGPPPS